MHKGYVLKTLAIFGSALLLVYGGFLATNLFHQKTKSNLSSLELSYTKTKTPTHPDTLIQVEISLKDDPSSPEEKLEEVILNGEKLTLKPADAHGKRGTFLLQFKPGTYLLCWKVKGKEKGFAKTTKYSKEITLHPNQLWVHILIKGTQVTITN